MDIVGSAPLLIVGAPLLLLLALIIRLDSRGPVLFHQERVGRRGKTFRLVKFRSMVVDAEARRGELLHCPRIPAGSTSTTIPGSRGSEASSAASASTSCLSSGTSSAAI